MKALVLSSLSLVLFIIAAPAHAQTPVQDTIPQLQEWWRADDMQYGKYGMTWLDNFYNGKGALVVWTPNGVQTWQMRFAGDIENVFTWQKGSANIKAGDFNGDGITDYVDENGNIYEGIQNGQPPKNEAQTPVPLFQAALVVDINGDGYDDMMTAGSVVLGKAKISDMKHEKLAFPEVDSNNNGIIGVYSNAPKELRILCRQRYWVNLPNFPFHRDYKNGLRLIRVWWNGTGFSSEKLDEFNVNTEDSTGIYWMGALSPLRQGKNYFICATMILGKNQNTNVTLYDLSKDKIDKLYSNRMDKIAAGGINSLRYGIDTNATPSICIRQYNEFAEPVLHIYNGNISDNLREIAQYTTVQVASLISLPDITGDGRSDIALSNDYFPSFEKYRFCVLSLKDSITSVNEVKSNVLQPIIKVISPFPVSNNQTVKLKISVPQASNYTLTLFDNSGKKIVGKTEIYQLSGEQVLTINIGDYKVSSGLYTLRLEGQGKIAQCTIIIQ
jgi:hypothetical protein